MWLTFKIFDHGNIVKSQIDVVKFLETTQVLWEYCT